MSQKLEWTIGFRRSGCRIEALTLIVALLIHVCWLVLTLFHAVLPLPLLMLGGGIVIAWHGSLQHETIHGHPTGISAINTAIGSAPLSLWLPYAVYWRTHIAHHKTPNITDPLDDPESQYVVRAAGLRYYLAGLERTLVGRLILGPPIRIGHFLITELRRARQQPRATARDWAPHLLGVAIILAWLDWVELSLGTYLFSFVYPGTAFTLLRSFAEHRADPDKQNRAAIIARAGPLGLLFLNNNLHAVHHARPDLPWYALPPFYQQHERAFTAAPFYASYGSVAARFWLRPHDKVVHPDYAREDVRA